MGASQHNTVPNTLEIRLIAERPRLVRLCVRLSGNPDAAEDLAQETMIEAWRNIHRLRDETAFSGWLSGIARNVCLRWMRHQAREAARRSHPDSSGDVDALVLGDWGQEAHLEMEIERDELATLLDRALALLPRATRDVLIGRYIEDSPYAEIAERLGLTEGAVGVRLHRGKLALRRMLTTEFRDDAAEYGLVETCSEGWSETRTWCPICGRYRLIVRFGRSPDVFSARCPSCHPGSLVNAHPGGSCWTDWFADTFGSVTAPKPLLNRAMNWGGDFFLEAISNGSGCCPGCGRQLALHMVLPPEEQQMFGRETPGVHLLCDVCVGAINSMSLYALAIFLPEGRQFWSEQRRICRLPQREVETGGRAAVVTSYQSLASNARLDAIWARDTYELLGIHRYNRA